MSGFNNVRPKPPAEGAEGQAHYASLAQSRDFWAWCRHYLPDPDQVLRKIGWHSGQLKEFILGDIQIQTVWSNTRLPFLSQTPWQVRPGDDTPRAAEAAAGFAANLATLDLHAIMEQLMDAVSLGYSVAEIVWRHNQGRWTIADLTPKPSHWFRFAAPDSGNDLLFLSKRNFDGEPMPPESFLVLRHRASYHNPYGDKLFSKLYWPVLFRRHGLEWWLKFVERFGAVSLYGKYDPSASQQQQNELLQALLDLLSGSVGIGPDNSKIEPVGDMQRSQGSTTHKAFMDWMDKAIAKAVIGQNLTSDSGDKGTQALGKIQFKVLEAITRSDQRLIASALSQLSRKYTDFNYGTDAPAPIFTFEQPEDIKKERAERDTSLYAIGWRPEAEYIEQHYGIPQEQFTLVEAQANAFASTIPTYRFSAGADSEKAQKQFADQLAGRGQDDIDTFVDSLASQVGKAKSFEDAQGRIALSYDRESRKREGFFARFAGRIDNLRHVSGNLGAQDGAENA